ncbi:MAG: HD domain-containing protein [bacterium]|nr:HD domain-containing protein [bacterium]
MKLDLTDTLYALSNALDTVQEEMGEISNQHGKNVAFISCIMGKYLNYDNHLLNDLVGLAILHDNAFTEYVREEYNNGNILDYDELKTKLEEIVKLRDGFLKAPRHCVVGERNIKLIPFYNDVTNVILYHHENADGSGPLGIKESDTNELAQIIHIADLVDVFFDLKTLTEADFKKAMDKIASYRGTLFSDKMVDTLLNSLTYDHIKYLQNHGVIPFLRVNVKTEVKNYSDDEIQNICMFFSKIIDYKSSVTKRHSLEVALKCYEMATYYHFSDEKRIRFFFAGAMHDIGKLIVNNDILEKPDKLTEEERILMMEHVVGTKKILSNIKEIDDIITWTSRHHERLDGSGYPLGLIANELSFEDRLLAVLDVYQALVEKRSYKEVLSHEEALSIMNKMVGKLDMKIVNDVDKCFKGEN